MSHESRVMSHESIAGRIAGDELDCPEFRTVDSDDALDVAFGEMLGILLELDNVVGLTPESKEQAAQFMGQRLLDNLAYAETQSIANDLSGVLQDVGKPYLVMVRVPDSRTN
ncbi:MAG: hypothetical protein Q7T74_05990 [Candidatus Saccharibacteria bacterium]|nr:hypothetical protein [Candidatus Saccharibacteria bacterium]